jgi:hypothetical protein
VVAEPTLNLDGVGPSLEQHRGAGMSEGVETSPWRSDLLEDRPKDTPAQVRNVERRSLERWEYEVFLALPLGCLAMPAKLEDECRVKGYISSPVPRLRWMKSVADKRASHLDVRARAAQRKVTPLNGYRL